MSNAMYHIFKASKLQGLKVLELIEENELPGEIYRVLSQDVLKQKFEGKSKDNKLAAYDFRTFDNLEIQIALDQGWITEECFTDAAKSKFDVFENNTLR